MMIELPDETVVTFDRGDAKLRGLRVGALFIRAALNNEVANGDKGKIGIAGMWAVEIERAPGMIACVNRFDVALLIADEVSRFVPGIETVRTLEDCLRVVSGPIVRWLQYACNADARDERPLDYRSWRTA